MTSMSEEEMTEISTFNDCSMDSQLSAIKIRMPRSHNLKCTCQRLLDDLCPNEEAKNVKLEAGEMSDHVSKDRVEHISCEDVCGNPHIAPNDECPLPSFPNHGSNLLEINGNVSEILSSNENRFITSLNQICKEETVTDLNINIATQLPFPWTLNNISNNEVSDPTSKDIYHKYDKKEMIGRGKFGKVFKLEHLENRTSAAAKEVPYHSYAVKNDIYNEIDILKCLAGGEYIVQLYEVIDSSLSKPRKMIIITEYLDGGDLFDQIAKEDLLTETQVIHIMNQILEGVNFIHDRSILHRDLKPENIIYCSKEAKKIKIIDFGFAVRFDKNNPPKSMVGTTIFVAPEVLRYESQSYQTDIWSLGVIAYDLLAGITPFEIPKSGDLDRQLTDVEIIENIERCVYDFDDEGFYGVSEDAKSFISSILVREPEKRLPMSQCREHSWLKSLHNERNNNSSCSVSIQRMKNYVALKKWEKIGIAIQSVNYFKASIAHG